MLKFIKQLFRRSNLAGPALQPSAKPPRSHPGHEVPRSGIAPVETAQISLAAILSKFNDELKASIARMPDPEATVALPVPTILKQLPTGSVKMSLASIRRQAPPGVFKAGKFEEKLMVDVPLGEIFRRVRPELLRRRDDQRAYVLPGEDFTLFNSKGGAAAAPAAQDGEAAGSSVAEPPPLPARAIAPPASSMAPRKVAPPSAVVASVARPNALKIGPKPGQPAAAKPAAKPSPLTPRSAPTPAPAAPAAPATPSPQMVAAAGQPPLVLALKDLSGAWPEPVNREIDAVPGVTVALPAADLTAGLARGKVAFTWGQLRSWMNPAPSGASIADEAAELVLPLRLIAPAFLKHSKREEPAKKAALPMDEEIPALFHGNTPAPKPAAPAPVETPAAEAPAAAAPEPVAAAAVEAEAPAPVPAAPAAPEVPAAPPAPAPKPVAQSVGEVFGQPEKANWSPVDIVQGLVKLPGIEGAIVALQEGLVVAHELPENLKGDVFAAFIPQIFARLNHYAGEMALGEVDDLLINLRGAHCQMYRRGQVYFAVLGKTGESLPSHELSLCAEALTK